MEETQQSRKKLIIKIYSSRPKNREGVRELKNKKGYYAEAIWIDVKSASKSGESNENMKRKKKEMVQKEWKKEKVENAMMRMDSCKKMQCWTMMKRLMVGRHAWVLKKNEQNKKVMSLKDIELKLKRLEYSKVDDFAYDMRNVFSYPLGYPPKSEIHKIAREITHDFELKWKTMKKKWILEKPNL
ncbi:transcription factor GTE12-like [Vigna umbellata]|uniref:transcription factor GTE12-like n=1 Tax=Vigna umbellata TaxID=87088 RepID=UPI001F5FA78A|nr:transcription factor GTE12-like [Vigna umbellata]